MPTTPTMKKVTVTFEFVTQANTIQDVLEVLGDIQADIDNLDTSWLVIPHRSNFFALTRLEYVPDAPIVPAETFDEDGDSTNYKEVDAAWEAWEKKANEVMGNTHRTWEADCAKAWREFDKEHPAPAPDSEIARAMDPRTTPNA